MIEVAVENQKPVRIGVNWGSLDQALLTKMMDENSLLSEPKDAREVTMEAMVVSALNSASLAEKYGLRPDQIILSAKVSGVQDLIDVYRSLAARCSYPLHLGLTEAGMGAKGIVASSAALGVLLQEGIGDTIRVSLTPAPGGDRTEEVRVGQQILQSLGIRSFTPQVTACPGCGRTTSTFFQEMAQQAPQNYCSAAATSPANFRMPRSSGLIRRSKLQSAPSWRSNAGLPGAVQIHQTKPGARRTGGRFVIGLGLTSIPPNSRAGTADLTR